MDNHLPEPSGHLPDAYLDLLFIFQQNHQILGVGIPVVVWIQDAGFEDIKITPKDNSRELIREWDPNRSKTGLDYVVSAYIEAVKPVE